MKNSWKIDLDTIDSYDNDSEKLIETTSMNDIAIIGVSCKLPMADTTEEFWSNLVNSVDTIRNIGANRLRDLKRYLNFIEKDDVELEQGGYLEEIDKFDYGFFGISPKEASLMDPSQRLFLETVWAAIEDAGYGGDNLYGSRTGLYLGYGAGSQYKKVISDISSEDVSLSLAGNLDPMIGGRISYVLNLNGPNMLLNTACSSSLVALHQACQALMLKECDQAIVGGVQVHVLPIREAHIGIEASDNRAKTFDDSADGTGGGEGVVAVLLKPLNKAIKDKDNIYAVIKGSAINHDGRSNGITAPNPAAQEDVITRAWEKASIDPQTVSYIETHGTGTKLGDPIEIDGISRAFRRYTDRKQFCAVSAVKSNIGHLDNAAGISGVLKAVLSLKNKVLLPTLHLQKPNSKIDFVTSPVYINTNAEYWEKDEGPRRCGVSAFSLSGTNCHVVLEEYEKERAHKEDKLNILALSAKSEYSLRKLIDKFSSKVKSDEELNLSDMCFTCNTGRGHYQYRFAMVFTDKDDFINKINKFDETDLYDSKKYINEDKEELNNKALIDVKEFISGGKTDYILLEKIKEEYMTGADIPWNDLYQDGDYFRVSLPTYPFKRDRCWIDIPVNQSQVNGNLFNTIEWRELNLENTISETKESTVLVFSAESNNIEKFNEKFRDNKMKVINVEMSDRFEKIDNYHLKIGTCESDYLKLIESINLDEISSIIHMGTMSDNEEINDVSALEESQKRGVYSLLYIIRALIKGSLNNYPNIYIISSYVNEITGKEEKIHSENSTMFGLVKSIMWEYPFINIKAIDIDDKTNIDFILEEIKYEDSPVEVAYRENKRYVSELCEVDENQLIENEIKIKKKGVYLITGGVGRIGLEIAKYLASKGNVNIALLNRSKIPERNEWDKILKDNKDDKLINIILQIKEIESRGSKVELCVTDICNENELQLTIESLRKKYGKLNGIVHCAGIGVGITGKTLEDESDEVFDAVLAPKVRGTWLLDYLTKDDNLDFFVASSSAITVIGGTNSGCYISANTYLDSFMAKRSKMGKRSLAINWSAWNKDGLLEKANILIDKQLVKPIEPDVAIDLFDKSLNINKNRIIIGQINYESNIFQMKEYLPFSISSEIKNKIKEKRSSNKSNKTIVKSREVVLKGKEDDKYNEVEKIIASIWQKVLGFDELSVYDNFFEIGGDSIYITKVHELIEDAFEYKVKVVDLFTYPTIEKLAEFIISKENKEKISDEKETETDIKDNITDLVNKLEYGEVSIDDAIDMFNNIEGN